MKHSLILLAMLILAACATPPPTSYFDALPPDPAETLAPSVYSAPVDASPLITESAPMVENAGEIYFFLQPRQTGGKIELARVSGTCVFDGADCPPIEKIQVPFALNFIVSALSWSPDGRFAAFAYPDNANGTPQKLFIFDPSTKSWTSIAEFPYIDPPFWSPDGNFVAFRTQDGLGGEAAYVVKRDGTDLRNISGALAVAARPYVMDGWLAENIIMRSAIAGNIYLVRASDAAARPMFDSALLKTQFNAAPDASLLAYDDYDSVSQKHALKVMQPDGANSATLASFLGGNLSSIVWSPDSQWIAFNYGNSVNGTSTAEAYVVTRDGSKIASVYKGITVGRLLFSPNGKYLLVEETTSATGGHLFVVNLAAPGQNILQAPGLSPDYDWYAPSWRP